MDEGRVFFILIFIFLLSLLYLINSKPIKPIKLEKFLQISTPPKKLKNACYFYNKVNNQGKVHFISYHFSNTIEGNYSGQLLALIDEIT